MALRFIDSMGDHYTAADVRLKWTAAGSVERVAGLHGYGLRGQFRKGMLFPTNVVIMECSIKIDGAADNVFFLVDTNGYEQLTLVYRQSLGSLQVNRYGGSLIGETAPDILRSSTWYHLGWKVLVHPTAGSVEVRLNGAPVLTLSGVPTTSAIAWSGKVGAFYLTSDILVANTGAIYDDLVVMDDVPDGLDDPRLPGGGGFTKFIGPVEVRVKRPSGPGLSAAFTPTPTVPNHQNVDDIDPDGDATVNTAAPNAVGATDLFAMEDLLPGEDVLAVQSLVLARKTDEGTAALATVSYDGVTTRAGTTVYQPSTYSYMHAPEPTAPDGTLWTAAKWNAIQYGYRRII